MAVLCCRLSPELTEKLDAKASEAGMERSAYIRHLILTDLDVDVPASVTVEEHDAQAG